MTITEKRANHVDFTLPYMATDIAMVVPLLDQRSSKLTRFFFLKPLCHDLWFVSATLFILVGAVVWAIERRHNGDFGAEVELTPSNQGKLTPNQAGTKGKLTLWNQGGTFLYFGFSTVVFAHRENLKSNLSRIVVVVWVFVVLILQSSYTATLTSMLTVPQVELAIADYGALLRGTEKVGIMNNSFTGQALKQSGFPQDRIVRYPNARSFLDALLNGSIGAIVNETPYFQMFLTTYSDNFTMTDQRNMTGGFGFEFPKGSPYVTDLSQAILKLTESNEIARIQRKWFGDPGNGDSPFWSRSLSLYTFRGLFLITGLISLACFVLQLIFNFRQTIDQLIFKFRQHIVQLIFKFRQPIQEIMLPPSSPLEEHSVIDVAGSPDSAPHTSEWSGTLEMAIPPADEIEPAASDQTAEVAPARQPDSSEENHREASN